jgi:very-short-patch-repair endonuclease
MGIESLFNLLQPRPNRTKLESPLEEIFIENLEKYLSPKTTIIPQYEVQTLVGKYRIDFVLISENKKIGIECDGKEFHDEWRDEWRDGLILQTGEVDIIYRFRGKDIYTSLNNCIYVIYYFDKELFNDRYRYIFPNLISPEFENDFVNYYSKHQSIRMTYRVWHDSEDLTKNIQVIIERRDKDKFGHWKVLVKYAIDNPDLSLEQLMKLRENDMK